MGGTNPARLGRKPLERLPEAFEYDRNEERARFA